MIKCLASAGEKGIKAVAVGPDRSETRGNSEAIQRRATKFILKSGEDYNTRLSRLSLHSLSDRRFTRDVVFLYSLIDGH